MLLLRFSSKLTPRIFFATPCLPMNVRTRPRASDCPGGAYVCIVSWSTCPHGGSVAGAVFHAVFLGGARTAGPPRARNPDARSDPALDSGLRAPRGPGM